MWLGGSSFKVYKGENNELAMEESGKSAEDGTVAHMRNFLAACRSRNHKQLNAEVEIGATSASLVHFANISYRVRRRINWDDGKKVFLGDGEATKLLTRDYRKPYVV
jgi:hypothetical protein